MKMNPSPSTDQILFLIRRIINEITTDPEKTKVTAQQLGMAMVAIEIDPWPADYGKILGRGTDHYRAMTMICKLISDRTGKNVELTMKRLDGKADPAMLPEFSPRENWRRDHIQALTEDIFSMIISGPYRVNITDGKGGATAIDVIVGDSVSARTVDWIRIKLQPLYKSIGLKNGRIIAFNIMQDETAVSGLMRNGASANR